MEKYKYHFLRLQPNGGGKSLMTLPGQMLKRTPVIPGIIVKDARGCSAVTKARLSGNEGDVFFTTTLKKGASCYTAKDCYPLHSHGIVFFSDAQDEFEKIQAPPSGSSAGAEGAPR